MSQTFANYNTSHRNQLVATVKLKKKPIITSPVSRKTSCGEPKLRAIQNLIEQRQKWETNERKNVDIFDTSQRNIKRASVQDMIKLT